MHRCSLQCRCCCQAEDGIRDHCVTGVQTCALPISMLLYGPAFAERRTDAARRFTIAYLRAVRDYYSAFFGDGQGREAFIELLTRVTPVRDREIGRASCRERG